MLSILRQWVAARAYSAPALTKCNVVVASIGNPSPQYDGSRHSVGHWVLDEVRRQWPNFGQFSSGSNGMEISNADGGNNANLMLAKSTDSYMNLQGKPISRFWHKYGKNSSLVIVHDELQIPLGKVQIRRRNTSARGHNGLRSIDSAMGNNYTKIAIGIGKPEKGGPTLVSDFVLSKFTRAELETLEQVTLPRVVQILDEMSQGKHVLDKHQK